MLVMCKSSLQADINSWRPLCKRLRGHVAPIQRLLAEIAASGICDKHGKGVPHVCAKKGHLEAVSELADAFAAQKLDSNSPVRPSP